MNDKDDDFPSFRSPMGYHNRYMRDGEHAPFAICGRDPDNRGGGVLFWAYSDEEARRAYDAYRACGYRNVSIRPGEER